MTGFNPWIFYKLFSSDDQFGYLSLSKLHDFVHSHGVVTSLDEMTQFVRSLIPDSHTKLGYQDFLDIVLPNRKVKARQRALHRASTEQKNPKGVLSALACAKNVKVKFALSQVIDHELRLFRDLELIKSNMNLDSNTYLLSLVKAMKQIDTKGRDGLDCTSVKNFLNKNILNFDFTTKDTAAIFRRLRLSESHVASFYQIIRALYPKERVKSSEQEEFLQSILKQKSAYSKSRSQAKRTKSACAVKKKARRTRNCSIEPAESSSINLRISNQGHTVPSFFTTEGQEPILVQDYIPRSKYRMARMQIRPHQGAQKAAASRLKSPISSPFVNSTHGKGTLVTSALSSFRYTQTQAS